MFKTFDDAAQMFNRTGRHSNKAATPFDTELPSSSSTNLRQSLDKEHGLEATLGVANLHSVTTAVELDAYGGLNYPIPDSFNPQIFDSAEEEIKYLVLTNTWPKFVHAGLRNASQESLEGSRSVFRRRKALLWLG